MNTKEKTKASKTISYILRHRPEKAGIVLDEQGYGEVHKVLRHVDITFEELEDIVATNDKKRYAFNGDKTLIRASQGHSIDVELGYKAQEPPNILFHGTAKHKKKLLYFEGIKKMNRHHVHLSDNTETAKGVGGRHGKPVIFQVNAGQMHLDGHEFFVSDNGVWLTEKVPPKYLKLL